MKKILLPALIWSISSLAIAQNITKETCISRKGTFIFAGGECIEYAEAEGDKRGMLTVIVHGTWKAGTPILARYTPFAETISMATDITTVAVALPGYSHSSTNHLQALSHNSKEKPFSKKEYIVFLDALIRALKDRYHATAVNYIGHSAGASMGATLTGYHPGLIRHIALAGGRYQARADEHSKGLLFASDFLDKLDRNTTYLLVYGTKDTISKPKESETFYVHLKKKNLNATLVEARGAKHLDLDMTDASVEAIEKMLE